MTAAPAPRQGGLRSVAVVQASASSVGTPSDSVRSVSKVFAYCAGQRPRSAYSTPATTSAAGREGGRGAQLASVAAVEEAPPMARDLGQGIPRDWRLCGVFLCCLVQYCVREHKRHRTREAPSASSPLTGSSIGAQAKAADKRGSRTNTAPVSLVEESLQPANFFFSLTAFPPARLTGPSFLCTCRQLAAASNHPIHSRPPPPVSQHVVGLVVARGHHRGPDR